MPFDIYGRNRMTKQISEHTEAASDTPSSSSFPNLPQKATATDVKRNCRSWVRL